jgi:hypothetical protein
MSILILSIVVLLCGFLIVFFHSSATKETPASQSSTPRENFVAVVYYLSWVVEVILLCWIWAILSTQNEALWGTIAVVGVVVVFAVLLGYIGKLGREVKQDHQNWLDSHGVKSGDEYIKREKWEKYKRVRIGSPLEQSLQVLADSLLPLFDNMSRVEVWITSQSIKPPDYVENPFMKGLFHRKYKEYTADEGLGFCVGNELMCLKQDYLNRASASDVEQTIKHELVHAWLCWKGIFESHQHGPIFEAKARELGIWKGTERADNKPVRF